MFEADSITSARRAQRALSFWRVTAILALAISFAAIYISGTRTGASIKSFSSHIARVRIDGLITGNESTLKLLSKIADSSKVKAVIIRIDSPGGTTVGSEALYEAIREIAKKKPVVAVMDSIAASGGYITALAADHVVARGNTITGSIGVLFQWAEIGDMLGKLGIKMQTIKSGDLKAEPNMFEPLKPEVRKVTEEMVRESFEWFIKLVMDRRKMDRNKALKLSDGRVFSGRQALKAGLIDELGSEKSALKWLQNKKKISKDIDIITWKTPSAREKAGLSLTLLRVLLKQAGLETLAGQLTDSSAPTRLGLDGLLSVWQPAR